MSASSHLRVMFRSHGWKELTAVLASERVELANQLETLSVQSQPEEISRIQGRIRQIDILTSLNWQEKAIERLEALRREQIYPF